MNRSEFSQIITYISNAVGAPPPTSLAPYWDFLEDMPSDIAKTAAKLVVMEHKTSTFPPIGLLVEKSHEITFGPPKSWSEGWKEARTAIRAFSRGRSKEGLASLPPVVRQVVERIGWTELSNMSDETAPHYMETFKQIYEELSKKEKTLALMPKALHDTIERLSGK